MTKEHYNSYKKLYQEWYNTTYPIDEDTSSEFHIKLGYHWDEMSAIERARAEGYEDGYCDAKLTKENINGNT